MEYYMLYLNNYHYKILAWKDKPRQNEENITLAIFDMKSFNIPPCLI